MPSGLTLTAPRRVFAAFAIYAFAMGNIFPRVGAIQTQMSVGEGALGLGLIGAPVGTLISLTLAAPLLERIGFRRALFGGMIAIAFFYALAAHAPNPLTFFFLLVPVGLAIGCVEVIVNVEADRVEYQSGYRIMNRAHAFWSFGFFAAGLTGAAAGGLGLSPQLHLGLVVPLVVALIWLLLGHYVPAPHRPTTSTQAPPKFAAPTAGIMVLVVVTLPAMLLEGGSLDWSAIYMRDVFGAGPFLAGFAVAVFAMSQFIARYFADWFVDRHSSVQVARTLFGILLLGCLTVFFSPLSSLSLAGFSLMAVGTSAIFPLAMSAAARRQDRAAVINIAALAQFSFIVFLLGPPLLGFVAEHYGVRMAFGLGLPLIGLSLWKAAALGEGEGKDAA